MTITETGQVGLTSTLEVFVQLGGPCAATENQEAPIGAIRVDQQVIPGSPAPFSVTSAFTPATEGSYFICGYLDGASDGSQVSADRVSRRGRRPGGVPAAKRVPRRRPP